MDESKKISKDLSRNVAYLLRDWSKVSSSTHFDVLLKLITMIEIFSERINDEISNHSDCKFTDNLYTNSHMNRKVKHNKITT